MKDEEILEESRVMIENSIAKEWEKIAYDKGVQDGKQAERKKIDKLIYKFFKGKENVDVIDIQELRRKISKLPLNKLGGF